MKGVRLLRYAATIFLSAFLLFQVQPLISKQILPWFGGTPAVWTTCMLFFQVLLLGGYAYAHVVSARLGQRRQMAVHLALLAAALLFLPIAARAAWKPAGSEDPAWRIWCLLAATVGLPYFLLSTTGPLLQVWFGLTNPGASPYWLYALSNGGSLLALLSYPFVVEPALPLRAQVTAWSLGFVGFAGLCGYAALRTWRLGAAGADEGRARLLPSRDSESEAAQPVGAVREPPLRPPVATRLLWVALPACGSLLLLAVTNQMCQDVAVVPFLWVLPLSLYLLSFILCFGSARCYSRLLFWLALGGAMAVMCTLMRRGAEASIRWQVVGYSASLFVCCMVCHGELVRLKPSPRHLTSFYLAIAAGGALGGILVGVVAPRVFPAYLELHVGLFACCLLAIAAFWRDVKPHRHWRRRPVVMFCVPALLAALGLLSFELSRDVARTLAGNVWVSRNFYGVLRVTDRGDGPTAIRILRNGRIIHGSQFLAPERRRIPTYCLGEDSGAGLALRHYPRRSGLRVGVIGLGAGTLAAYGLKGDHYTFYEINPGVKRLATQSFTYLADFGAAGGSWEIEMGDARLSMERQVPQHFDILVLDAFSGDAIPVHLLTKEAFGIYLRHLTRDGVIAVHISNLYLDLYSVVRKAADHFGLETALISGALHVQTATVPNDSVLVTRNREFLARDPIRSARREQSAALRRIRLWTDDYSNLFQILR